MNLLNYQSEIAKFDQSPIEHRPRYYVMGMADELSEIAAAMLWYEHEKTQENAEKIVAECGDFLWYFTRYATYQDVNIAEIQTAFFGYESSLFINSAVLGYLQLSSALAMVLGFEKKLMRGDDNLVFNANSDLTYIFNMFTSMVSALGGNLELLAELNYNKLSDRLERGVIKGSGDDR